MIELLKKPFKYLEFFYIDFTCPILQNKQLWRNIWVTFSLKVINIGIHFHKKKTPREKIWKGQDFLLNLWNCQ